MTMDSVTAPDTFVDNHTRWRRIVAWTALGVAAAIAVSAFVMHAGSGNHDGPTIRYSSAQAMAAKAGCASSFIGSTAYAGVTSTGSCTVRGSKVMLVVLPNVDAAYAWLDGANAMASTRQYGGVGDGWVVYGPNATVQSAVGKALTTP
jgi:hypothetical protein